MWSSSDTKVEWWTLELVFVVLLNKFIYRIIPKIEGDDSSYYPTKRSYDIADYSLRYFTFWADK